MSIELGQENIGNLFKQVRDLAEAKTKESSETKVQLEKLNGAIDKLEKDNQGLVVKQQQAYKDKLDLEEGFNKLEKALTRLPSFIAQSEKAPYIKSFEKAIQFGGAAQMEYQNALLNSAFAMTDLGKKYLRTDSNVDGGFLVPPEYVAEIIKKITEISPIRQIARVRSTTSGTMRMPIRNYLMVGGWAGEAGTIVTDNSQYGRAELKINKLSIQVPITIEELQDAAFDMQTEINADAVERFAQLEGAAFVNGTGVEQPFGFMQNSLIPYRASGVASTLTFDCVNLATGDIKRGYNPVYLANRRTTAFLRTLKDAMGRYIWTAGNVQAGVPNAICGYPYMEAIDMPDIGSNTFPIIFGDFARGYLIGDRMMMSVIRDDYTLAGTGEVRFVMIRRVGAQVVLPEAFVMIKCSVS
jgi:HK97 family phage major capsid protein